MVLEAETRLQIQGSELDMACVLADLGAVHMAVEHLDDVLALSNREGRPDRMGSLADAFREATSQLAGGLGTRVRLRLHGDGLLPASACQLRTVATLALLTALIGSGGRGLVIVDLHDEPERSVTRIGYEATQSSTVFATVYGELLQLALATADGVLAYEGASTMTLVVPRVRASMPPERRQTA